MPLPGIAVVDPTFNPSLSAITVITSIFSAIRGNITQIDTQSPHTFVLGQIVKFLIPIDYGMPQINGEVATVIGVAINPNQFFVNIDSRSFEPFVVPAAPKQFAQVFDIGEINSRLTGASRNVLGTV